MSDGIAWRHCPQCGRYKDPRAFYDDGTQKGRHRPKRRLKCRVCTRVQMRKRYEHKVEYVRAYKLEHGCADCGFRGHHYALDFDHLPGKGKTEGIGRMLASSATLDDIKAEIERCEVVCSNCHRVRTFERDQHCADWDRRRKVREADDATPAPEPPAPAPIQLTLEV